MEWQLAEAKNKLSEVVSRALEEGPQRITRRNQAVIVISEDEYARLTGAESTPNFIDFLFTIPDLSDVDLSRSKSLSREIDF